MVQKVALGTLLLYLCMYHPSASWWRMERKADVWFAAPFAIDYVKKLI